MRQPNGARPINDPVLNKASPTSMVSFPLLLIPLAVYNIIVFLMPGVSFADPLFRLTLVSGAVWGVNLSDMLLALAVLLLLLEVIKGARPGAKYLMDHLLSLVVFCAAAAEFLLWPKFASSTYFLLVLLSSVDFLSGLALRVRRPQPVAATVGTVRHVEATTAAPGFEPATPPGAAPASVAAPPSATPVASATATAESVPSDHPRPQPAAAGSDGSPQIAASQFQPNGSTPASPAQPQG